MPPFVPIEVPPGRGHNPQEQGAVALGLYPNMEIAVVRQRGKGIEFRSHVKYVAVTIHERQIDRNTP